MLHTQVPGTSSNDIFVIALVRYKVHGFISVDDYRVNILNLLICNVSYILCRIF